jgi:Tol biopolymer transport system component
MGRNLRTAIAVIAGALLLGIVSAVTADATFPGKRGRIAYATFDGIYAIRPDGGGNRRVAPRGSHDPDWSADGRRLLYQRGYASLWRARGDGSHARRIARLPLGRQLGHVAWAPDGRRAAIELYWEVPIPGSDDDEVRSRSAIYVIGADGRGLRQLHRGADPAWSPDGALIAFTTARGIEVIRPDGNGHRLVHRVRSYAFDPDFSPDGRRLVYRDMPGRIHTLELAAGRDRALPRIHGGHVMDVRWTPDGTRIAYLHQIVPRRGVFPPTRLFTIRPDGGRKHRVLTLPPRLWADELSWQPLR